MKKPKTSSKRKYVVTLSIETAEPLTKKEIKKRVLRSIVDEFAYGAPIRIRTVDFD